MGKETKIGLAVIGLLLLVFGVLLFRKMTASDVAHSHEPAPPAAVAVPSSAADKPNLVETQHDSAERSLSEDRWSVRGRELDAESAGGAPPARFMPREDLANNQPTDEPAHDRYAKPGLLTAAEDDGPPRTQTRSSNPFPKSVAPANSDQAGDETESAPRVLGGEARDSAALEAQEESPVRSARNPLRRLSAQTPVGLEVPEADRLQADFTERPIAAESGLESGAAEPAGPEADLPLAGDEDQAPVDHAGPRVGPLAAPTQWQSSDATERPLPSGRETLPMNHGKYTVQPNDSLWTISEKVYGTGGYFKAIYEHNRATLPRADRLAVGTVLAVPPSGTLEQNYPALCPKQRKSALVKPRTMQASAQPRNSSSDNVYVVEEGDTLFDIARYELGKASRWAEIYDLNREILGEDFDYLQPGTELTLPVQSSATESLTRQRDSRSQR